MMRTALYCCTLLLLAACGSKGPLIMPPEPGTPSMPKPAAVDNSIAPAAVR